MWTALLRGYAPHVSLGCVRLARRIERNVEGRTAVRPRDDPAAPSTMPRPDAARSPCSVVSARTRGGDVDPNPTTAVRALGLTKVYGSGPSAVRALVDVDVDFAAGAFTAIMGPSGSGKSTLMHLLAGLDSATSGQAYIGDTDTTTLDDRALTRLRRERVGFVFQSFNLLPMCTAEQNIVLPLEMAGRPVDDAWLEMLVATLRLHDRLDHRPSELSGGEQQRVAIARAQIAGDITDPTPESVLAGLDALRSLDEMTA